MEKAKGEFDTDQGNREAEIACKHKLEEDEAKESAKNRKLVAKSSAKMCETLAGSMQVFERNALSLTNTIDDKLSHMQHNIMSNVDQKWDEKISIKDMLRMKDLSW
jgi:hypothetical protein